jgi:GT2 family glycosyltransferase
MSDRIAEILEEELAALTVDPMAERLHSRPQPAPPPAPHPAPNVAAQMIAEAGAGARADMIPRAAPPEFRNQLLLARSGPTVTAAGTMPAVSVDTAVVSANGGVFIVGWCDDVADSIDVVRITGNGWRVAFDGAGLARVRRRDVEEALGTGEPSPFGFFGFVYGRHPVAARGACTVEVVLRSGATQLIRLDLRTVEDAALRAIVLTYLTQAEYCGNGQVEVIAAIEKVIGRQMVILNNDISSGIIARPHVERFVSPRGRKRASIIVCLYGRPEYLFLQNAAFFSNRGIDDVEFIYVSNSPELAERLMKEARNAHLIYGIDQTLVLLSANAGFGAANNAAAAVASSDRLLFVNPDVFPIDNDWAVKHAAILADRPEPQTRLFGAPLYYNDGSLMHGGMYFDVDVGLSVSSSGVHRRRMARVEHYGKGAPPNTASFVNARPVPAVTGAFISVARSWFEGLGGFTEDYVFGHYEDADLCLKSLRAGTPSWMHDVRFWHLEGKGSTRLPVHEGGSTINRWLFSDAWLSTIDDGLIGPEPAHPAFKQPYNNHHTTEATGRRHKRARGARISD